MNWREHLENCVDFTQRLIQTPSMPFEEKAIANLIAEEMQSLGFDEVWLDDFGNVFGRVIGKERDLGAIVLNSHLDHVDPGDPALWPVPPYSGVVVDDFILGRGACDIKGPLAVQLYSMAALLEMGERPRRDVVFSGVVQEEIGGEGAVYWAKNLDYTVGLIVLGEPSSNQISLGHRGLFQMWVTFHGRSVHASVPDAGENPNYTLGDFLHHLRQHKNNLGGHPILGPTTVAPTIIEVDTQSMNVIPAWTRILLDFRTATESPNSLVTFVKEIAGDVHLSISDALSLDADPSMPESDATIYGFYTSPDSAAARHAQSIIAHGMGWRPDFTSYQFATDGRHFVHLGVPIIGYSPAEERFAHTVDERISIPMMADSLQGHVALLRDY